MERPMQKLNDLSRSLTALEPDGTLIAVIEMSLSSWLVAERGAPMSAIGFRRMMGGHL
jgi:hypothetical protein